MKYKPNNKSVPKLQTAWTTMPKIEDVIKRNWDNKQNIEESYGGELQPSIKIDKLPKKFNGSQKAARTYAEGYIKSRPIVERIHSGQYNFLDNAVAMSIKGAGLIGLTAGLAVQPVITIPAVIGGMTGSNIADKIVNKQSNGKYKTWSELIRNSKDYGQTVNLLTEFTNPGAIFGGTIGGLYGRGVKAALPTFNNTKNYYLSKQVNDHEANKLAIANTLWEMPLHKTLSKSRLGKIGTYYLMRMNGGDSSGASANLGGLVQMFKNDGEFGITNSNLKDNYKLGLFRNDPILSKIFKLDRVKYRKINSAEAIKANREVGSLINKEIPENVPGTPAVNNTNADIFEIKIDPNTKYVYRRRPTYHSKKYKDAWIPVGSTKSISKSHAPFLLNVNADLGGHWEKGLWSEPVQIYDWNHFTPLDYSKKWGESGLFQIYRLTGLNRMWKPFAFYGKSPLKTKDYILNYKNNVYDFNMNPNTKEL